jgi:hypothetical protein
VSLDDWWAESPLFLPHPYSSTSLLFMNMPHRHGMIIIIEKKILFVSLNNENYH